MSEQEQINKIKKTVEEFFDKMTIGVSDIKIEISIMEESSKEMQDILDTDREVINLEIETDEPQILIGQQGQTLFEIQRLLRTVLNKRLADLSKVFFLNLDINGYKRKKIDYLKYLAKDSADQVAESKEEKSLLPMSSYERRVIHAELSKRTDVITESRGDGYERHIVIKSK